MNDLYNIKQRYTLHPIQYHDIWNFYKKQLACFWIASEIDFSKDKYDWDNKLSDNEQYFLKYILAFFAASDTIVQLNILNNFINDVKILEAQITYNFQATMEGIHSEVYSIMIDTYIDDENDKNNLFNAIKLIPCIKKKAEWAFKWASNNKPFVERILAYIIVEGIFFSGAFCAIYWIKERGILPGLTKSNEFIARDEGLHTNFGILLFKMYNLNNYIKEDFIHNMISEAVNIENEFITESLPVRLIGMNNELMTQYIKYVADWILVNINYNKLYNVINPFSFMNNLGIESKSNFFDERTSTYQNAHVFNTSKKYEIIEDF